MLKSVDTVSNRSSFVHTGAWPLSAAEAGYNLSRAAPEEQVATIYMYFKHV